MSSVIHAFLIGEGRDARGRTVHDVLGMSDADLEHHHDYIQWLFPLPTHSAAVPGSPFLSLDEIATIQSDPRARSTLQRAVRRMVQFLVQTLARACSVPTRGHAGRRLEQDRKTTIDRYNRRAAPPGAALTYQHTAG